MLRWMPDNFFIRGVDLDRLATYAGKAPGSVLPRDPDLTISPDGTPYLYRWHIVPRNDVANVYLHLQVADDPERPLHDHRYDSQSVILSGGYRETFQLMPMVAKPITEVRDVLPGRVIHRRAEEAHHLALLPGGPGYSISLFTTGPEIRTWGFWTDTGWKPWFECSDGDYREGGITAWKDKV